MTTRKREESVDAKAKCMDCRQGYTIDGGAGYPDHIELCKRHADMEDTNAALLAAAKEALSLFIHLHGKREDSPAYAMLRSAIARAALTESHDRAR